MMQTVFLDTGVILDYLENRNQEVRDIIAQLLLLREKGRIILTTSVFNVAELIDKEFEIHFTGWCLNERMSFDEIYRRRRDEKLFREISEKNKSNIEKKIKNFIFNNEITVLNEEERGPNLDLLLSTLKDRCKILTLSSHVGNAPILKSWLNAELYAWPPDEVPEEYIATRVGSKIGIENRAGTEKREYVRSPIIKAIIQHSNIRHDDTMMVLVGTRSDAERRACDISRMFPPREDKLNVLVASDEETSLLTRLNRTLKRGVAFHHAGLSAEMREYVEILLDDRRINIVVSTPTLSHGVDFPLDHVVVDLDSFGEERLKRIEYVQYRGRAARIGKSRGGNVYVFSKEQDATGEKIRRFLSKPVEDLFPPSLDSDHIERIVLLASKRVPEKTKSAVLRSCKSTLQKLLTYRNPRSQVGGKRVEQLLSDALRNLKLMKLISVRRNKIALTDHGIKISTIDWVPFDSYRVLKALERVPPDKSDENIELWLLFTVSYIGLLKGFDRARMTDIILTYVRTLAEAKRKLPNKSQVKGLAVSSVLFQWINEVPIEDILSNSTSRRIVHDEDIRKLGNYAGVEMGKIALLAENLGCTQIARVASKLAVRLKRGVKEDLVSEEPLIDLSRLLGIGRRRSRLLYALGFKNLLDIYSLIFKHDEEAFIKKSKLPEELGKKVTEQLRNLVQSDYELAALCKEL